MPNSLQAKICTFLKFKGALPSGRPQLETPVSTDVETGVSPTLASSAAYFDSTPVELPAGARPDPRSVKFRGVWTAAPVGPFWREGVSPAPPAPPPESGCGPIIPCHV